MFDTMVHATCSACGDKSCAPFGSDWEDGDQFDCDNCGATLEIEEVEREVWLHLKTVKLSPPEEPTDGTP